MQGPYPAVAAINDHAAQAADSMLVDGDQHVITDRRELQRSILKLAKGFDKVVKERAGSVTPVAHGGATDEFGYPAVIPFDVGGVAFERRHLLAL